jgi:protein-tyrosine phosphatase
MTVLTVCTGNICRSPAAERLLAATLGPGVRVSSAGTGAVVGHGIQPDMAVLLKEVGIDTGWFSARQLTEDLIRDSTLILTMTRRHRSAVARMVPDAVRRTYTLLEFARIAAMTPHKPHETAAGRLRHLVSIAPQARPLVKAEEDDDVPDPYGGDADLYATSFDLIRQAVNTIASTGEAAPPPTASDSHSARRLPPPRPPVAVDQRPTVPEAPGTTPWVPGTASEAPDGPSGTAPDPAPVTDSDSSTNIWLPATPPALSS